MFYNKRIIILILIFFFISFFQLISPGCHVLDTENTEEISNESKIDTDNIENETKNTETTIKQEENQQGFLNFFSVISSFFEKYLNIENTFSAAIILIIIPVFLVVILILLLILIIRTKKKDKILLIKIKNLMSDNQDFIAFQLQDLKEIYLKKLEEARNQEKEITEEKVVNKKNMTKEENAEKETQEVYIKKIIEDYNNINLGNDLTVDNFFSKYKEESKIGIKDPANFRVFGGIQQLSHFRDGQLFTIKNKFNSNKYFLFPSWIWLTKQFRQRKIRNTI